MGTDATSQYLGELLAEKENIDPAFIHATRLLAQEIDRVQTDEKQGKMLELHNDKPSSLSVKIRLPVNEYPKVNFPGRIIGKQGMVMKQFQEKTGTKLCVFGKGSMTDKVKEEELRQSGGKYAHLNEELHVKLEVFADPVECYRRISIALQELKQYLGPYEVGNGPGGPMMPANGRGGPPPRMHAPGPPMFPRPPMLAGVMPGPPRGGAPVGPAHPDPWAAQQGAPPPGQPNPYAQTDPYAQPDPYAHPDPGAFDSLAARGPAAVVARPPRPTGPFYGGGGPPSALQEQSLPAEQFGGGYADLSQQGPPQGSVGGGRAPPAYHPSSGGPRQPRPHPYQAPPPGGAAGRAGGQHARY